MRDDGRVGAATAMAAAAQTCTPVASASTAGTLYDCAGRAESLRAAA